MGKADRFKDFNQSPQPGPGKYLLEGFTDKLIRENKKKNLAKQKNRNKAVHSEVSEIKELKQEGDNNEDDDNLQEDVDNN